MSLFTIIKGKFGELQGSLTQAVFLDNSKYRTINNVTIEINDITTQIDHVIISEYGIFVVEDKNINGLIFGDENSQKWTIVNWKYKYQIQNPLKQNYRHMKTIVDILGISLENVHSIIVFRGNCSFKTVVPDNVLTSGYIEYIKKFNRKCFSEEQVDEMYKILDDRKLKKGFLTDFRHIESLHMRYSSNIICPKCGGKLVKKIARQGPYKGKEFLGCSNYPECHYIKSL